jgi:hypothetical protein
VLPVIRNENFLLVTLVSLNAFAASAIPIFMHKLVNEIVAIILSVTAILIFGEIIPQALCSRWAACQHACVRVDSAACHLDASAAVTLPTRLAFSVGPAPVKGSSCRALIAQLSLGLAALLSNGRSPAAQLLLPAESCQGDSCA